MPHLYQTQLRRIGFVWVIFAGGATMTFLSCHKLRTEMTMPRQSHCVPADLVIWNARVWCGREPFDHRRPGADTEPTAIAVRNEHISAVGDDARVRREFVGPRTRVIDAGGRRIIPGLTDSHTHFISGGFQLARVELRDVPGKEQFIAAVQREVESCRPGEWVQGGRWSVESWTKPETPNRTWLDPFSAHTPIFLSRMDGHSALVNAVALKLAGIDANGPADPIGGEIERDPATREPTGILKDAAMDLVTRLIPPPDAAQRRDALDRAMKHANSLGVTSVHDMSDGNDLATFEQAAKEKALTVRVTSYVQSEDWNAAMKEVSAVKARMPDSFLFHIAGLKGYMDGSMGSRTAYLREPFADASADAQYPRGQLAAFALSREGLAKTFLRARSAGLVPAVHAIGDEANHILLNAYGASRPAPKNAGTRSRIEHAQHLIPSDIPRFAQIGVVASMQPLHKADDARYVEKAIGKDRLKGSYAFRSLIDANALVIFGSDWPVVSIDPFAGIHAAVTARALDGSIFMPEESITVEEALVAYTSAPALAIGRHESLGLIRPGMIADFVILTADPFAAPPDALAEITAQMTIVNGEVVYERQP